MMPYLRRLNSLGTRAVLVSFVGLTSFAIIGQTFWAVDQDRRLTLASEKTNGLVAVRLLEEHAKQQLTVAAHRLDTVNVGILAAAKTKLIDDVLIHQVVEETLKNSRSAGALQFVNIKGDRWASTIDFPSYIFDAEPRGYIDWLLNNPAHKDIYVGLPFERFIDGELVLPLARNLYDQSGQHLGLISTEVTLSYFSKVYERVARDSEAEVQLLTDSGFVIVSSATGKRVNAFVMSSSILQKIKPTTLEGSFEEYSVSSEHRLWQYSFRKVNGFAVTTVLGREIDKILVNWRARTWDRVLFSSVFIAFHLLLTWFLLLHMDKLQRSEKRLRSSEGKFIDLFQRSPLPLALFRFDDNKLIEVNDVLLGLFGFSRAAVIGKTPLELGVWADPAARSLYIDLLKTQGHVDSYEARLQDKNGKIITCLLSTRIFDTDGEKVGIFSPIDVSRQREIEDEVRQLNAQLEQRVEERTSSLHDALRSLTSLQSELIRSEKMAALGKLVAGVAHELNTPLGNSLVASSSVQEYAKSLISELQAERPRRSILTSTLELIIRGSDIVVRNLERAATLVSSFKQVAADRSNDMRRQFDLQQTLREVILTLEPMVQKEYLLELDLAPDIIMDSYPGSLAQVITNFVSNATIHAFDGREHGVMHLSTRALGENQVAITFSDDGAGIAEEHIARVFDPFFTTKFGQGGSGLGMNIVYNIVTNMLGGSVTLQSTLGKGTTICVTLPMRLQDNAELSSVLSH